MEEHLSPLAVTHLLQHTLRSLCLHENSQWVYAVFWRILPRNFPPPKWDVQGGAYDRSRGNKRNWILVWEDGFCNFAASTNADINSSEYPSPSVYGTCEFQHFQGLQPKLFFKMSHEVYNYGEGSIGKVAADHSHKWIYKEPNEQETNILSAWHSSAGAHPRTWDAQFQSGIKTIALIAVREGVVQLGSLHKVMEDLSYVVLLRKKFGYIESIPGVLLPHPSSSGFPYKADGYGSLETWHYHGTLAPPVEYTYDHLTQPMKVTPSMSSLEALLSKLPSVVPATTSQQAAVYGSELQHQFLASPNRPLELMGGGDKAAKEENEAGHVNEREVGECSSSMGFYHHHQQQHQNQIHYHEDLNVATGSRQNNGF
ncbi:hypothetical protein Nepgr_003469 [Nepenthes gracilis]|uniref:Transcription factor MYC/MYB N-terminal domain-containing protein n=1 Tax=Nepenthes gracilis TaxID=150966 RepID=A0AAD3RZL4_NEPGR|nr:hypothetical protein Nepgr_003469 [Nepenthes gracilis]